MTVHPYKPTSYLRDPYLPRVVPLRRTWRWWTWETAKGLMGRTLFLLAMGLLYFLILVAAEAQRTWR